MKVELKKDYKSLKRQPEFNLPDFVVLTGKNGSGKSHLMEAMSNVDYCAVSDNEKILKKVRYIGFNGLNPKVNADSDYLNLTQERKNAWSLVKKQLEEWKRSPWPNNINTFINSNQNRRNILGFWFKRVDGNLDELTEEFVLDNYEISSDEMFSSQFASIFKLYQIRYEDNEYLKYLNEKKNEHNSVLSENEFISKYGPKPWDLINEMLTNAQLPYRVNHPKGHKEASFHLNLTDVTTGVEIQVNDLSTGEKVLMSLALSIYNSNEEMAKPDVLLLDEPDAPLHPEFSKVFIVSVIKYIVKRAGVKVVISTHSPTTVAIAPEDSLFRMNKDLGRPEKITKEQAINILIQDLENVRLSLENRRQIFVESKYDAQYYNRIFNLISQPMKTSPQFLPPKSGAGTNCDEVSDIVNALRKFGNDLVYGIKDFDNKNHSSNYILVLGEGKRYAIDNYIFDPIFVAFLLIRENIIKTEDVGLPPLTYVTLSQLENNDIQILINYILTELELLSSNILEYNVQGGDKFEATNEYFSIQGHLLEDKIKKKWPKLHSIANGGDNKLKNYVLETVCKDYPQFLSVDFIELFDKIK